MIPVNSQKEGNSVLKPHPHCANKVTQHTWCVNSWSIAILTWTRLFQPYSKKLKNINYKLSLDPYSLYYFSSINRILWIVDPALSVFLHVCGPIPCKYPDAATFNYLLFVNCYTLLCYSKWDNQTKNQENLK